MDNIRLAENKDIEGINKLLYRVETVHRKLRPDLFKPNAKKYSNDELRHLLKNIMTPVFVYEEDGEVRGYCFCRIQNNFGNDMLYAMKTFYIDDICVDEDAEGKGMAQKLFDYVKDYAYKKGAKNITLNVWEGNDRARAFYEKMGFFVRSTTMELTLRKPVKVILKQNED